MLRSVKFFFIPYYFVLPTYMNSQICILVQVFNLSDVYRFMFDQNLRKFIFEKKTDDVLKNAET